MSAYEAALGLTPCKTAIYTRMGSTLIQLRRAYKSVAAHAQALRLDPNDLPAALELGNVH
jgi:cytochrome c-type biogenesis protein CcmH/NrfG